MTTKHLRTTALLAVLTALCISGCGAPPEGETPAPESAKSDVRHVGSNPLTGGANAVVTAGSPLAHTAQFFALDQDGAIVGAGDVAAQTARVLDSIDSALSETGSSLVHVVKLNVYVRSADVTEAVKAGIAARFQAGSRPAICLVEGAFSNTAALVAMDAIATTDQTPAAGTTIRKRGTALASPAGTSHVSVLPLGTRVYISGRAARQGTTAEATTATMVQLKDTLAFVGLGLEHVIHVKSFMQPISERDTAQEQIIEFFSGNAPPMAFTEWTSSNPIEIEIIATSPDPTESQPLEYLTPPGDKASPVFSRIAKVYHPSTIYVSGLWGAAGSSGTEQIHAIYASLKQVLAETGSDLNHLAKTTYYPSDDDPSAKLNEIRPEYYDPKRPPAASKALVAGTGFAGRTLTLDMIAVPAR
jgi:enamine deaminase RidA (YjgF/YER057c/UK114 family)